MITRMKVRLRDVKYWFQRRIRGWSDDETWAIDLYFIKWLKVHLEKYLKDAGKAIDLEFHKFEYKGKKYNLFLLVNKMIYLCDKLLAYYEVWDLDNHKKIEETKNELLDIFKLTFFYLGW